MKLAFTGYYGMENYGDDLFVLASTYGAHKYWNTKPTIVGMEMKGIDAKFQVNKFGNLYSGKNVFSKFYRMQVMLKTFIGNDIVVMAGGSTISSDTSNRMRQFQYRMLEKRISKMAAIGVSLGPFNNKEDFERAKRLIERFEYIAVRDELSFNTLKSMNVKTPYILGRDIAGVIPLIVPNEKSENKKEVLGISICNYESFTNGDVEQEINRNKAMISAITKFGKDRKKELLIKICVLNLHPDLGDMKISKELQKELNKEGVDSEIVFHNSDPLYMWKEITSCDAFFSVRLHGAITAYLGDIPFVLIEYHEKCSSFLDDVGYLSDYRIKPGCNDDKYIYEVIEKLFSRKEPVATLSSVEYSKDSERTFLSAPWSKTRI